MPWYLIDTYINVLPKLQAEEVLIAVQVGQVASGLLEKSDQRKIIRRWKSLAELQPRSVVPTLESFGELGISVETRKPTDG